MGTRYLNCLELQNILQFTFINIDTLKLISNTFDQLGINFEAY